MSTVAPFQVFGDFRRIVRLVQTRLQRLQRGGGGPPMNALLDLVSGFDGIHNRFVRRDLIVPSVCDQ